MLKGVIILALYIACVSAQTCPSHDCAPSLYRSVDGSCNNLEHPRWGVPFNAYPEGDPEGIFYRSEPADYYNISTRQVYRDTIVNPIIPGADLVAHPNMSSPREFSNVNLLFVYLTQFLTHDMANTGTLPISGVDVSQLTLGFRLDGTPMLLGPKTLDVFDSEGIPQQANNATSYIDLSTVYGSNEEVAKGLRLFSGGLLRTAGRRKMEYKYTNDPNLDSCDCYNTTSGERIYHYNADGSNFREVRSQTLSSFIPQPAIFFGINSTRCISPALASPFAPPMVMKCHGGVGVAMDIVCETNMTVLNSPRRASLEWTIPDDLDWQPFANETDPQVMFDEILSGGSDPTKAPVAGDARNVENYVMFIIHNLKLRVHNSRARELSALHPTWNDESLYQEARKYTIANWQHIVYNEIIPIMVGDKAFRKSKLDKKYKDKDYDPRVDPRTGNLFAAAAMRWGHSTIPHRLYPLDPITGERIVTNYDQLFEHQSGINNPGPSPYAYLHMAGQVSAFSSPDDYFGWLGGQLNGSNPENSILLGAIKQKSQKLDRYVENSIALIEISNCFVPNQAISVPAFTVFRGRTHGLMGYHDLRIRYTRKSLYHERGCNKPRVGEDDSLECFRALVDDAEYAALLKQVYKRVDNIDPWIGLILEGESFKEDDALVGKTASEIIIEQFERSRVSDRFWYENSINGFTECEMEEIKNTTFRDLLVKHFPEVAWPADVFKGVYEYN